MAVNVTKDNLLDLLITSNNAMKQQKAMQSSQPTGSSVPAAPKPAEEPKSYEPKGYEPKSYEPKGYESKRSVDLGGLRNMGGKNPTGSIKEYSVAPAAYAVGALDAVEGAAKAPWEIGAGYYYDKDTYLTKREAEGSGSLIENVENRSKKYKSENQKKNDAKADKLADIADSISLYGWWKPENAISKREEDLAGSSERMSSAVDEDRAGRLSADELRAKTKKEMEELKAETGAKFSLADLSYTMGQMAPSQVAGKALGKLAASFALGSEYGQLIASNFMTAKDWADVAKSTTDVAKATAKATAAANALGEVAKAGQSVGSLGTMFGSVYGSSYDDAIARGATRRQATDYALSHAMVETGTELLGGGVPGMNEGILTRAITDAADKMTTKLGARAAGAFLPKMADTLGKVVKSKAFETASDIIGEGIEEMISEVYSPWIEQNTLNPDAPNATLNDVLFAGLTGAVTSALMQGGVFLAKNAASRGEVYSLDEDTGRVTKKTIEEAMPELAEEAEAIGALSVEEVADRKNFEVAQYLVRKMQTEGLSQNERNRFDQTFADKLANAGIVTQATAAIPRYIADLPSIDASSSDRWEQLDTFIDGVVRPQAESQNQYAEREARALEYESMLANPNLTRITGAMISDAYLDEYKAAHPDETRGYTKSSIKARIAAELNAQAKENPENASSIFAPAIDADKVFAKTKVKDYERVYGPGFTELRADSLSRDAARLTEGTLLAEDPDTGSRRMMDFETFLRENYRSISPDAESVNDLDTDEINALGSIFAERVEQHNREINEYANELNAQANVYGLDVKYVSLPTGKVGEMSDDGKTIYINSSEARSRAALAFVYAHETGHQALALGDEVFSKFIEHVSEMMDALGISYAEEYDRISAMKNPDGSAAYPTEAAAHSEVCTRFLSEIYSNPFEIAELVKTMPDAAKGIVEFAEANTTLDGPLAEEQAAMNADLNSAVNGTLDEKLDELYENTVPEEVKRIAEEVEAKKARRRATGGTAVAETARSVRRPSGARTDTTATEEVFSSRRSRRPSRSSRADDLPVRSVRRPYTKSSRSTLDEVFSSPSEDLTADVPETVSEVVPEPDEAVLEVTPPDVVEVETSAEAIPEEAEPDVVEVVEEPITEEPSVEESEAEAEPETAAADYEAEGEEVIPETREDVIEDVFEENSANAPVPEAAAQDGFRAETAEEKDSRKRKGRRKTKEQKEREALDKAEKYYDDIISAPLPGRETLSVTIKNENKLGKDRTPVKSLVLEPNDNPKRKLTPDEISIAKRLKFEYNSRTKRWSQKYDSDLFNSFLNGVPSDIEVVTSKDGLGQSIYAEYPTNAKDGTYVYFVPGAQTASAEKLEAVFGKTKDGAPEAVKGAAPAKLALVFRGEDGYKLKGKRGDDLFKAYRNLKYNDDDANTIFVYNPETQRLEADYSEQLAEFLGIPLMEQDDYIRANEIKNTIVNFKTSGKEVNANGRNYEGMRVKYDPKTRQLILRKGSSYYYAPYTDALFMKVIGDMVDVNNFFEKKVREKKAREEAKKSLSQLKWERTGRIAGDEAAREESVMNESADGDRSIYSERNIKGDTILVKFPNSTKWQRFPRTIANELVKFGIDQNFIDPEYVRGEDSPEVYFASKNSKKARRLPKNQVPEIILDEMTAYNENDQDARDVDREFGYRVVFDSRNYDPNTVDVDKPFEGMIYDKAFLNDRLSKSTKQIKEEADEKRTKTPKQAPLTDSEIMNFIAGTGEETADEYYTREAANYARMYAGSEFEPVDYDVDIDNQTNSTAETSLTVALKHARNETRERERELEEMKNAERNATSTRYLYKMTPEERASYFESRGITDEKIKQLELQISKISEDIAKAPDEATYSELVKKRETVRETIEKRKANIEKTRESSRNAESEIGVVQSESAKLAEQAKKLEDRIKKADTDRASVLKKIDSARKSAQKKESALAKAKTAADAGKIQDSIDDLDYQIFELNKDLQKLDNEKKSAQQILDSINNSISYNKSRIESLRNTKVTDVYVPKTKTARPKAKPTTKAPSMLDTNNTVIPDKVANFYKDKPGALNKDGKLQVYNVALAIDEETPNGEIRPVITRWGEGYALTKTPSSIPGKSQAVYAAIGRPLFDTTRLLPADVDSTLKTLKAVARKNGYMANDFNAVLKSLGNTFDARMRSGKSNITSTLLSVAYELANREVSKSDIKDADQARSQILELRNELAGEFAKALGYDGIISDAGAVVFSLDKIKGAEDTMPEKSGGAISLVWNQSDINSEIEAARKRLQDKRAAYAQKTEELYQAAGERYGTIDETDVPKRVADDGRRTSRFAATNRNNPNIVPEALENNYQQMVLEGMLSYAPVSDNSVLENTQKWMSEGNKGLAGNPDAMSPADFRRKYEYIIGKARTDIGKFSESDILKLGQVVAELSQYAQSQYEQDKPISEDAIAAWEDGVAMLSAYAHEYSLGLHAFKALKKLSARGRLFYAQNLVDKFKNDPKINLPKGYEIPQEYIDEIARVRPGDTKALNEIEDKIITSIARAIPPTLSSRTRAWRMLCMLGNARTHVRNIVSNGVMAFNKDIARKISARVEDNLAEKLTAKGQTVERTKTADRSKPVTKELLDFAKRDAYVNEDILREGGKRGFDTKVMQARPAFSQKGLGNVLNRLSQGVNIKEEAEGGKKFWQLINKLSYGEDGQKNAFGKAADYVFGGNSGQLEMEDWWFLKGEYTKSLAHYMAANDWTPEYLERSDAQALRDLNKAREYAINQAWDATYRQVNKVAEYLNKMEKEHPFIGMILEGIIPFKKTPLNILIQGIRYSPIGLIDGLYKATKPLSKGTVSAAEVADRIGQGLTGTGTMAIGALLGWLGLAKAGGSDDKTEEYYDQMLGDQEYSLRIGGKNFTIDWLTPMSMPLMAGVELSNYAREVAEESDDLTPTEVFNILIDSLTTMADPMTNLSVLSGVKSVIETVGRKGNPVQGVITNAAENYALQFVPTISGQTIRTFIDPRRKTTYAPSDADGIGGKEGARFMNKLQNKSILFNVAGKLRDDDTARYIDQWGREEGGIENMAWRAFNQYIAPWYVRDYNRTYVDDKLAEVFAEAGKDSSVYPKIPSSSYSSGGVEYPLSEKEYERTKEIVGQLSYAGLESAFRYDEFNALDATIKSKIISKIYEYAKASAKENYAESKGFKVWFTSSQKDNYLSEYPDGEGMMIDVRLDKIREAQNLGISVGQYFTIKEMLGQYNKKDEKKEFLRDLGLSYEQREVFL